MFGEKGVKPTQLRGSALEWRQMSTPLKVIPAIEAKKTSFPVDIYGMARSDCDGAGEDCHQTETPRSHISVVLGVRYLK